MSMGFDRVLGVMLPELKRAVSFSRPKKLLFDHLPKCGGSSLGRYFSAQYIPRRVFTTNGLTPLDSVREFKEYPEKKRYSFDLVQGHCVHELLDYVHPECIKATLFRDPVDRIVSYYFYARQRDKGHYLYSTLNDTGMGLDEFVGSDLTSEIRNFYTCHFLGIEPCVAESAPQESVAKAADLIRRTYDVFGFLEDVGAFVRRVSDNVGFSNRIDLPRANATKGRLKLCEVSDSVIRKIEDVNFLDVELYKILKGA